MGQLTTNFYCGFLLALSNSGQTVVVWFVSLLDGRGPRRALKDDDRDI